VAPSLPDDLLGVGGGAGRVRRPARGGRELSRRGAVMAATPTSVARDRGTPRAFRPGVPATEAFPLGVWRLAGRVLRRPAAGLLGYGEPAGYDPLQREISDHLGPARAVRCEPGRVIVVSGSLQALDLCARVLLDPGDAA